MSNFMLKEEYLERFNIKSTAADVEKLYQITFGRNPTEEEKIRPHCYSVYSAPFNYTDQFLGTPKRGAISMFIMEHIQAPHMESQAKGSIDGVTELPKDKFFLKVYPPEDFDDAFPEKFEVTAVLESTDEDYGLKLHSLDLYFFILDWNKRKCMPQKYVRMQVFEGDTWNFW